MFELECEHYLHGENKISFIGVNKVNYDEHGNDLNTHLWHNRMGHFSKLPNVCQTKGKVEKCDSCALGKIKKKPFKKNLKRSDKPLHIVHSDLMGPLPVKSAGGSTYVMTFLDDHSRFSEVYFLKSKSETFERFQHYQAKVERFHDAKLKIFQSDNGTEYKNGTFRKHFNKEGIEHRRSNTYTPEQNGRA